MSVTLRDRQLWLVVSSLAQSQNSGSSSPISTNFHLRILSASFLSTGAAPSPMYIYTPGPLARAGTGAACPFPYIHSWAARKRWHRGYPSPAYKPELPARAWCVTVCPPAGNPLPPLLPPTDPASTWAPATVLLWPQHPSAVFYAPSIPVLSSMLPASQCCLLWPQHPGAVCYAPSIPALAAALPASRRWLLRSQHPGAGCYTPSIPVLAATLPASQCWLLRSQHPGAGCYAPSIPVLAATLPASRGWLLRSPVLSTTPAVRHAPSIPVLSALLNCGITSRTPPLAMSLLVSFEYHCDVCYVPRFRLGAVCYAAAPRYAPYIPVQVAMPVTGLLQSLTPVVSGPDTMSLLQPSPPPPPPKLIGVPVGDRHATDCLWPHPGGRHLSALLSLG